MHKGILLSPDPLCGTQRPIVIGGRMRKNKYLRYRQILRLTKAAIIIFLLILNVIVKLKAI